MSAEDQKDQRQQRRSEAFFGRRKAKTLSKKAEARFERLYPVFGIDPAASPVTSEKELFAHNPSETVLEIGFGGGEHLVHQALANPQNGYIGVEPFVNSMAKALRAIEEHRIENIRLYDDDAVILLDWLPDGLLDRVDLLYPDPWPKLRHWKRRFVNEANLQRIARVLKPGGRFHFASDIDTYVNWTLQHCAKSKLFRWQAHGPSDWRDPFENWTRTRYEAKAVREGRTPCYLRFQKK